MTWANKGAAPNAGGRRLLAIRTPLAARVGEVDRSATRTRIDIMGMGGPGDHPIGDLIHWGRNPFPPDIADMLRQLYAYDPKIRDTFALDAFDWEEGRALDEGRAKLRAELAKHQAEKR